MTKWELYTELNHTSKFRLALNVLMYISNFLHATVLITFYFYLLSNIGPLIITMWYLMMSTHNILYAYQEIYQVIMSRYILNLVAIHLPIIILVVSFSLNPYVGILLSVASSFFVFKIFDVLSNKEESSLNDSPRK